MQLVMFLVVAEKVQSKTSETMTFAVTQGTVYIVRVANTTSSTGSAFTITATIPTPTISTGSTLSAVNTVYGTASATPTTFTVSGTNMSAGILVTPPSGFEVSLSSGSGYASTLTVGAAGTIASTTVYVRLAATAAVAGSPYSGDIVLTSAGATTVNKATVSSTVAPKGLTITGLTGDNKPYDGLLTATFTGTPAYSGLANSESFTVSGTPSANLQLLVLETTKQFR